MGAAHSCGLRPKALCCNMLRMDTTAHTSALHPYGWVRNQLVPAVTCLLSAPRCARAMGQRQSPAWWLRASYYMLREGQA